MIREFNSYREILAIDPGLQATGWAVLSDKTGALLACGIAQPFAQVSQTHSIAELRLKILKIWEERVGFSKNPAVLAVEMDNSIPLSVMSGLLWASFSPGRCYLPKSATWKTTQEQIMAGLDMRAKKVLAEDLHVIPKHLRHNVYDAIGIGQWAFKQLTGEAK